MARTASEAGWHLSRYNLMAQVPGTGKMAIANLFRGTCGAYTPAELYLLDELDSLDEDHPMLKRFSERGLIVNFDEREALYAMGRKDDTEGGIGLTICPTMGCNFDCPYCFERHGSGCMSAEVQNSVINLAERMLDHFKAKELHITWFGGEPLLAPEVITSLSDMLLALCEKRGTEYDAAIVTNGYLLTQEIADMLGRYHVRSCQITLDGIGAKHDATRHLAGGGATFGKITENLRKIRFPFSVTIRHNVHTENSEDIEALRRLVKTISDESGNKISYYPAPVRDNEASEGRRSGVCLICGTAAGAIGIKREAKRFAPGKARYCLAHRLSGVAIDDSGNLYKCWEDVDKPNHSFGSSARWDPENPIRSADRPDNLTRFLNTALPNGDKECDECIWLPHCTGGCPNKRVYYKKECVPYKDMQEQFVLALYERMKKENKDKNGRQEGSNWI
jgi:uncharacterized protein